MSTLTEQDSKNEMKKMVAFIVQEASEKSREIQVKADEEFNIEKAKIVRQESKSIEAQYERKMKQADIQRKIACSTQINKSRLEVLKERDLVLDEIHEETIKSLKNLASEPKKYKELLVALLLQGLYKLMDGEVAVECREGDKTVVQDAIDTAKTTFEKETKMKLNIQLSDKPLFEKCAGGVILSSLGGRIRCDNTFATRLEYSFDKLLPKIKVTLFGATKDRRFFD